MNLLLVGYGSIGRRHLANARELLPAGARFTVVEPQRDSWEPSGGATFLERLSEANEHYDVALVCSPTALHGEHVAALAGRARAFFIEKPLAHDVRSLEQIGAALSATSPPVMVGCNYRFEAGLLHVRELLAGGTLGRPLSLRAEFGQWLPSWRPKQDYRAGYAARRGTGGGIVLDRIHELDYVSWLLGPVVEVKAMHGKLSTLEIETEDVAELLLRFTSGAIGSVHVDYLQREYVCRAKIVCERGTLRWRYRPTSVVVLDEHGGRRTVFEEAEPDVNAMYVAELRHFLESIASGVAPCNGLDEASATTRLALAALGGA